MRSVLPSLLIALSLHSPHPVAACELALVLAVDVSGSVDRNEYRLQMGGLAEALRDGIVSEALVRTKARIMLIQWTGSSRQQVTIPWTRIDGFDTVQNLADRIETDPRIWQNYSTAIGEALLFSLAQFDQVPDCTRHLIDLSGDGISNEGAEPADLRQRFQATRVVLNALAIEESEPDLTAYFYENVIQGEGAFVVTATGFADYPAKIRRKLLREVTRQTAWATAP